ncbi:MAG: metallophosphoesterase [Eubacterium sp.]|jgi:predicted MPP superfamily phosphohydrolase|nr:metallophosphoesterase [Eubacterium sp.]
MDKRGYIMQFVFVGIVLIIYGLLNYYIGLRGIQGVNAKFSVNKIIYWIIIFLFAVSFIVGMLGRSFLPELPGRVINTIGGYWIAAFVYLLCLVIIIDIFRLLGNRFNLIPAVVKNNTWFIVFSVVAAVVIILAVGTYNAIVPKVNEYEVSIDKKAGNMSQLKCTMISDIHLGEIIGRDRLHNAVELINKTEPDLVVIAGDLFDSAIEPVKKGNMLEELKGIKSRFGTYVVLGNHDYFSNSADEITSMIEATGAIVLRDKAIKVNDSFYLVGREDKTGQRFGYKRTALEDLLKEADTGLPVIVLDHQPSELNEPRKAGVDLQLSGHTHAGQFFPANLVTNMIFEEDFGHFKDGSFNLVVSCGYGTWGPTVRIGSQSEVVKLNISFTQ